MFQEAESETVAREAGSDLGPGDGRGCAGSRGSLAGSSSPPRPHEGLVALRPGHLHLSRGVVMFWRTEYSDPFIERSRGSFRAGLPVCAKASAQAGGKASRILSAVHPERAMEARGPDLDPLVRRIPSGHDVDVLQTQREGISRGQVLAGTRHAIHQVAGAAPAGPGSARSGLSVLFDLLPLASPDAWIRRCATC